MGMALGRGRSDNFDVPYAAWNDILELAERYGWRPTRTGPRRGTKAADWCGSYYSSDGQRVYARDAAAIAEALARFLAGEPPVAEPAPTPDRDRLQGVVSAVSEQVGVAPNVTGGLPADSWLLDEGGRQYLREFVAFCRRGTFWMG
ncbi:MAG: hypothetical protein U0871_13500 [Gemmataceae bacterium]